MFDFKWEFQQHIINTSTAWSGESSSPCPRLTVTVTSLNFKNFVLCNNLCSQLCMERMQARGEQVEENNSWNKTNHSDCEQKHPKPNQQQLDTSYN